MEWLKTKSLKLSFFMISLLFLCGGLILSALSFVLCVQMISGIEASPNYKIILDENREIVSPDLENGHAVAETEPPRSAYILLLNVLQFALPVFFVVLSLVLADITFYRLKLKKPLGVLQNGAERIKQQDLNFKIEKYADDEMGLLCTAFEEMRLELLKSNRELWRQMEERKRLNAAFSHDLRNPVTVLKGSAKLAKLGMENGKATPAQMQESLSRIEDYTNRIERYIEIMSRVQRLEQITLQKKNVTFGHIVSELEHTVQLIASDSGKFIGLDTAKNEKTLYLDEAVLFQIAENLVVNALRFARYRVQLYCAVSDDTLTLTVTDDGCGFSSVLLKNGVQPFQKGSEEAKHFGMGLYICDLLCQKHGGHLVIGNGQIGGMVSAFLKIN